MTKIAVTGAGGMVGRHMLSVLSENSINCLTLTRKDWDVTQWKTLDELDSLFKDSDAVFHFAAQLPNKHVTTLDLFDANVRSCLNIAQWAVARSVSVIFLSSATVYKDAHKHNIKELDEKVVNGFGGFYGYTKYLAENILEHYRFEGLKVGILRPSSLYGHGLPVDKLIPKYLLEANSDGIINVTQPNNCINLIHAYDVACAALSVFKTNSWGVFNVSSSNYSVYEIAKTAVLITGKGEVSVTEEAEGCNQFTRFDLDCTLAKNAFGFEPLITLEEGMRLTHLKQYRPC